MIYAALLATESDKIRVASFRSSPLDQVRFTLRSMPLNRSDVRNVPQHVIIYNAHYVMSLSVAASIDSPSSALMCA